MTTNSIKLESLEIMGVKPHISKLLMSKNDADFLIGWELVEGHPNREHIRAYCKGQTSTIVGLESYWIDFARKYHNNSVFKFENIILK